MQVNERIKKIREHFCNGNNIQFAEILGVSPQYASDLVSGGSVGNKKLDKILEKFPKVNPVWLKMNIGDMIENNINQKNNRNINIGDSFSGSVSIGDSYREVSDLSDLSKEELFGLLENRSALLAKRSAEYQLDIKERFAYVQKKDDIISEKNKLITELTKQKTELIKQISVLIEQNNKLTAKMVDI